MATLVIGLGNHAGGTLAFGRTPAASAGVGEAPDGARKRAEEWPP